MRHLNQSPSHTGGTGFKLLVQPKGDNFLQRPFILGVGAVQACSFFLVGWVTFVIHITIPRLESHWTARR